MISRIPLVFVFLATLVRAAPGQPVLTPAPRGPYRIAGNQILDRANCPWLMRGTRLPVFEVLSAKNESAATAFGPWSATTLITIRQRLNMNTVRISAHPDEFNDSQQYQAALRRLVLLANRLELLVVLDAAAQESTDASLLRFWAEIALQYKNSPDVFFAIRHARFESAIRQSGARQPIIVRNEEISEVRDPNVILEDSPDFGELRADRNRLARYDDAATPRPVLVSGLDPELALHSKQCAAFPSEPTEAASFFEDTLRGLDHAKASWIISSFEPGRLITDYRSFNGTKLDFGWECGRPQYGVGVGLAVLAHLWNTNPLALFTVSESRGGFVLARGGIAHSYGPILAEAAVIANTAVLPTHLSNISVRITDSHGVARLAPLFYTLAGWSSLSFVVPDAVADGPADVDVMRTDGSVARSKVLIAEVAPALLTQPSDGRSVADAVVTQRKEGTQGVFSPVWRCARSATCDAIPIRLSPDVATTLQFKGTGFRHARANAEFHVFAGSTEMPLVSWGISPDPGTDHVTVRVPGTLAGIRETDVYCTVDGVISNVVRVNFGAGK
jgi:uncharacterized protein (TIGR03437 family)